MEGRKGVMELHRQDQQMTVWGCSGQTRRRCKGRERHQQQLTVGGRRKGGSALDRGFRGGKWSGGEERQGEWERGGEMEGEKRGDGEGVEKGVL